MKTLAFLLILSCAACTEMKPMSDFGMAVYNGKPEPLENYRGRFKVGAIVAPEEPETFRSAVELSLSENQLLAPDLEKERYVIDVNFEKIDSTDISSAEIRVEVTISYSVHQIQPKKPVLADKIVIATTVPNPVGKDHWRSTSRNGRYCAPYRQRRGFLYVWRRIDCGKTAPANS